MEPIPEAVDERLSGTVKDAIDGLVSSAERKWKGWQRRRDGKSYAAISTGSKPVGHAESSRRGAVIDSEGANAGAATTGVRRESAGFHHEKLRI